MRSVGLYFFSQVMEFYAFVQSGLMDEGTKLALLGVWMALFVLFAGRKFTQPIKVEYIFFNYDFDSVWFLGLLSENVR